MYDWLLFDLDNTLMDFSAAEASGLQKALAPTELEWSDEILGIYREINHQAWTDYEAGKLPKDRLRDIRFEELLDRFKIVGDPKEISRQYRVALSESDHMMEGAMEVMEAVKGRFRLGMVTNGLTEVQYPRLAKTGLDTYFETIVVSDEIGVAKPQAAFFDHAFQHMEQPDPESVLVIGDNPVADIGGALSYGCHACWVKKPNEFRSPPMAPTYEIQRIAELLKVLNIR